MCSFPSAPRRSFASSCKTIRYSTVPCNLGLLRMRREQVALHLERDSNKEKAHQPKVQFLRRTFGLQGSIGGDCRCLYSPNRREGTFSETRRAPVLLSQDRERLPPLP